MLGDRRDLSTDGVTCRSQLRRPLDDQSARHVCGVRVFVFVVPPYVVSPVTWTHHMVWAVPVIIWLAAAPGRLDGESTTVRSGRPGSQRKIISRGSLRGKMVLAGACLSLSQLV